MRAARVLLRLLDSESFGLSRGLADRLEEERLVVERFTSLSESRSLGATAWDWTLIFDWTQTRQPDAKWFW